LTRFLLLFLALTCLVLGYAAVSSADHVVGTACGSTRACAGHQFWPKMTQNDVQKAAEFRGTTLNAKQNASGELLGWHGSDTLTGGNRSDVLWGDHDGTGQPTGQWDRMYGGDGSDFIYSSRGRNTIEGGNHNDAIKARYGRGVVNCGPGKDIVHIPKRRKRNWKFKNCEKFEYRTESQVGHGLKPLAPFTP
jgi:Ca2+-binding RTX toxin-like protein